MGSEDGPKRDPCRVFVGNLPYELNDTTLGDEFAHIGKVVDSKVSP